MTERESQYPFEKIWIDVRKILIYRTDYITHNMKLQSGAGVPKKSMRSIVCNPSQTECNHHEVMDVILSKKGM